MTIRAASGFTMIEVLISLVISAVLITALTLTLHASLQAYATAAQSASTRSAARLVSQQLVSMIRTADLHDAFDPDDPQVSLDLPSVGPVQSVGIAMMNSAGDTIRVYWQSNDSYDSEDVGDLMYRKNDEDPQLLLTLAKCRLDENNDPYVFTLASRQSDGGLLLNSATIDLTVYPDSDSTLSVENAKGRVAPVRLVGSTIPRRSMMDP